LLTATSMPSGATCLASAACRLLSCQLITSNAESPLTSSGRARLRGLRHVELYLGAVQQLLEEVLRAARRLASVGARQRVRLSVACSASLFLSSTIRCSISGVANARRASRPTTLKPRGSP
jgi:hypothetical protein